MMERKFWRTEENGNFFLDDNSRRRKENFHESKKMRISFLRRSRREEIFRKWGKLQGDLRKFVGINIVNMQHE